MKPRPLEHVPVRPHPAHFPSPLPLSLLTPTPLPDAMPILTLVLFFSIFLPLYFFLFPHLTDDLTAHTADSTVVPPPTSTHNGSMTFPLFLRGRVGMVGRPEGFYA